MGYTNTTMMVNAHRINKCKVVVNRIIVVYAAECVISPQRFIRRTRAKRTTMYLAQHNWTIQLMLILGEIMEKEM